MQPLESLLTLGGLLAVGRAAPRILLCARLRGERFRAPSFSTIAPKRLPRELDPIFDLAAATLSPLGFEPRGARIAPPVEGGGPARPQRLYVHPPSGTLAVVGPPRRGSGDRPLQAFLVTRRRDGAVVATFDAVGHLTLGLPADWECEDLDVAGDLSRQWSAHLARLGPDFEAGRAPLEARELSVLEARAARRTLEAWERDGLIARVADGAGRPAGSPARAEGDASWRLRLRGAWELAGRMREGRRTLAAREAREARTRARLPLWQCDDEEGLPPRDGAARAARIAGMAWRLERIREMRRRARARGLSGASAAPLASAARLAPAGVRGALLLGGALALAGAGWSARSPLLVGLALAVAAALPGRWRAARAAQRLRTALARQAAGGPRRAELACSALQDPPFDRIPTERRIELADATLAAPAARGRPLAAVGRAALYVTLLVGIPITAHEWSDHRAPAAVVPEGTRGGESGRTAPAGRAVAAAPGARTSEPPAAIVEAVLLSAPTPLRTLRPGGP